VTVAHDKSEASKASVAVQAAAAEAECLLTGAPPDDFFIVGDSANETEGKAGVSCCPFSLALLLPVLVGLRLVRSRARVETQTDHGQCRRKPELAPTGAIGIRTGPSAAWSANTSCKSLSASAPGHSSGLGTEAGKRRRRHATRPPGRIASRSRRSPASRCFERRHTRAAPVRLSSHRLPHSSSNSVGGRSVHPQPCDDPRPAVDAEEHVLSHE
jgi:hypothetical protein